ARLEGRFRVTENARQKAVDAPGGILHRVEAQVVGQSRISYQASEVDSDGLSGHSGHEEGACYWGQAILETFQGGTKGRSPQGGRSGGLPGVSGHEAFLLIAEPVCDTMTETAAGAQTERRGGSRAGEGSAWRRDLPGRVFQRRPQFLKLV